MGRLHLDDDARALLAPVQAQLDAGVAALPAGPAVRVRLGDVPGFAAIEPAGVVLSTALTGPGLTHPDEPAGASPPLDRWRRAAGCALEAVVIHALAARAQTEPSSQWWWVGLAVDLVDRAVPALGLALPELALARTTGDLGAHPRAGVAAMRAWRAQGVDPWERVLELLAGEPVDGAEWLGLGAWVLGAGGAGALLVPVRRLAAVDFPVALGPWRWQPLAVPAHRRGGELVVEGTGAVQDPFAVADVEHHTLAGSLDRPARVDGLPGGPVGAWRLASASGFNQTFGARGVTFAFSAGGRFELTLADSFVGPAAALDLAAQVGTSGVAVGRWRVAGARQVHFHGLKVRGVTTHGRDGGPAAMPMGAMGAGGWVASLEGTTWRYTVGADGALVLDGAIMGGPVQVVLRPS